MKYLVTLVIGFLMLVGFQNCSEVGFDSGSAGLNGKLDTGGPGPTTEDPDDGDDDDGDDDDNGPGTGGGSASDECGRDGQKVLICHIPPGNPANQHTICIGAPAVRAHIAHHGDILGECGGQGGPIGPTEPVEPSDATTIQ